MNSKAEFNRCHIPRLVVEVEDQETKLARLKLKKEHREELQRILNDQDLSWEEQKTRAQEIAAKKRRRDKDCGEQESHGDGAPRKRARRLRYETLAEDWGAVESGDDDGGEEEVTRM